MPEQYTTTKEGFLWVLSCLGDLWVKGNDDCPPTSRATALIGLLEAIA